MQLSDAIDEFLEYKEAVQRLSKTTLVDYRSTLKRFQRFMGDARPIEAISARDVRKFLGTLDVSKKRIKNIHVTLSSLWSWALQEGICDTHIVHTIQPPKPEKRVIVPFSRTDIEALLSATNFSLPYSRVGKRQCKHRLQNTLRDQVIILFLLDTGVRASELCKLRVSDIGKDGVYVRGKGSKDRIVPMSDTVRAALQEYLRAKKRKAGDRVFQTIQGNPMTPSSLRGVIKRMARRAGVPKAHPHRFRHTFAINFLRNGGDVFSLQRILGHETLDMVKRYLAIAKSDITLAHAKASPVTRWGLDVTKSQEML